MQCVNAAEESISAVLCFGFLASLSSQSIDFFPGVLEILCLLVVTAEGLTEGRQTCGLAQHSCSSINGCKTPFTHAPENPSPILTSKFMVNPYRQTCVSKLMECSSSVTM